MNSSLNKVTHLSGVLKGLLPMKEEYQRKLDKKFRLEFNYNSNHLEGNTLTYGETELLLIFDETKSNIAHNYREYEEMKAHDVAYALIREWAADKEHPLTESNIKNLNEIILVRPFWKDAVTPDGQDTRRQIKVGDYKEYPNSVRLANGEIFDYASPADTPIQMGELMNWYRQQEEEKTLHPVELAALFHYKFVCIHPFDDGNGRISRLLMNYVLLRNDLPPVIIKSVDKRNYLQALHQADVGEIGAFVDYIADQEVWSLEISIKAAKGESIDEPGDFDKKVSILIKKVENKLVDRIERKISGPLIGQVLKDSIRPLAIAWETKLKELDSLFISRDNTIRIDNHPFYGNNFNKLIASVNNDYLYSQLASNNLPATIAIRSDIKGIQSIVKVITVNAGEISFAFHEYLYEVKFLENQDSINKLYNQPLNPDEINLIVNHLSNLLADRISEIIETYK